MLRVAALAIGLAIAVLMLFVVDRVVGLVRPDPAPSTAAAAPAGLIYPPGQRIKHVTAEFDYSATINSMGFRGEEPGDSTLRIAAFGDSFVYGWGVDDDATWVTILEDSLRARLGAPNVEIVNLGAPGTSPMAYAGIAERAIPALRPKLVLVGVLQAQDFAQTWWETQSASERVETLSLRELPGVAARKSSGLLSRIFPNFAALLAAGAPQPAAQAQLSDSAFAAQAMQARQQQAVEIERMLSRTARARFERLAPEVREAFRKGDINPPELYYALRQPDYLALTTDVDSPRGREVLQSMTTHLRRIRESADAVGARTVVLSLPYGAWTSRTMCTTYRSFGYRCDDGFLTSSAADDAIVRAARGAGIDSVVVLTDAFRAAADSATQPLFYRLDGHFTREGNRAYAAMLAPRLVPIAATALR